MSFSLADLLPLLGLKSPAERLLTSSSLEFETAKQSLRLRAQQSVHAMPLVVIAACVVAIIYISYLPKWRVAGWIVPIALVAIANGVICKRLVSRAPEMAPDEVARGQRMLWWFTVFNTCAMGSGMWWIGLGTTDPSFWFFTTTIQCLYSIGALINASTHPPTFITGTWINLGQAASFWLMSGGSGAAVSFSILGLAILLTRFSRQIHADFAESIRMRFENIDLIRSLEVAKRQAESAQQTAEQANIAKSKFLAAASHDLRQPLHALMLFSELLLSASQRDRQLFVVNIRQAADALNKLFGGLLDLSRLDANVIQPSPVATQLKPLIESIAQEFRPKAEAKGLALGVFAHDVVGHTDPFLLERIVRNLVDNAVKYTDTGSVNIRLQTIGEHVRLSVEDTGIGIDVSEQERVFNEFYQLNNPTRSADKGTGLGLAIVRRLCNLMGHSLSLKSTLGRGSVFAVDVDSSAFLVREDPGEAPSDLPRDERLEGLSVIVIDDDLQVLEAMRHLLQNWGCRANVFNSIESAVSTIDALGEKPNAVIADFRLHGDATGFDAIIQLRERYGLLPAAIFTGDTEGFFQQSSMMPDIPIFRKPVRPDEISNWLIRSCTE